MQEKRCSKDCGFEEVFDIFDEIDIIHHELNQYNPRTVNKINIRKRNAIVFKNYGTKTN